MSGSRHSRRKSRVNRGNASRLSSRQRPSGPGRLLPLPPRLLLLGLLPSPPQLMSAGSSPLLSQDVAAGVL
eukprot:1716098-Pyramimonas_sp.AAC.1